MILKNTPENLKLCRALQRLVNQKHPEAGCRARIDATWNLGADIRFSIGTLTNQAPARDYSVIIASETPQEFFCPDFTVIAKAHAGADASAFNLYQVKKYIDLILAVKEYLWSHGYKASKSTTIELQGFEI